MIKGHGGSMVCNEEVKAVEETQGVGVEDLISLTKFQVESAADSQLLPAGCEDFRLSGIKFAWACVGMGSLGITNGHVLHTRLTQCLERQVCLIVLAKLYRRTIGYFKGG